jgi:hypothetical protein
VSGYVTRGRAGELEAQLAALEARLTARIDQLEADVRRERVRSLELVKRANLAMLGVLRDDAIHTTTNERGG